MFAVLLVRNADAGGCVRGTTGVGGRGPTVVVVVEVWRTLKFTVVNTWPSPKSIEQSVVEPSDAVPSRELDVAC